MLSLFRKRFKEEIPNKGQPDLDLGFFQIDFCQMANYN
jgi:hypothetical protein